MVTVKFSTHRAETLFLMPTIAIEQYNSETAIRFVFYAVCLIQKQTSNMAKQEMFVTVYRLEAYNNYDALDGFMEAICDYAIISKETDYALTVVASSEALSTSRLANMAYKYFGKEGYTISTLGLLGPFKKFN